MRPLLDEQQQAILAYGMVAFGWSVILAVLARVLWEWLGENAT